MFFILKEISLIALIDSLRTKLPTLDPMLALKSLIYFDDISEEEILYKVSPISFGEIKSSLVGEVTKFNEVDPH